MNEMQVRTYSRTFWKRYRELGDDQGEKYIKQIERGEQRIQRQQDIMDAIAAKMDRYRNPWQVPTTPAPYACQNPCVFVCVCTCCCCCCCKIMCVCVCVSSVAVAAQFICVSLSVYQPPLLLLMLYGTGCSLLRAILEETLLRVVKNLSEVVREMAELRVKGVNRNTSF